MPTNGPELRDIHVPHISPWWPLAPGWWMLLCLLAIACVVVVLWLRRRRAWKRHVDAALAGLRDARARYATDGDAGAFAASASDLVRRIARTRDVHSVTLSGDAWRAALSTMAPKHDIAAVSALDTAKYRRDVDIDVDATARVVEAWARAAMRRPSPSWRHVANRRRAHVAS
ncbi:protein of unknown function [Luteibacter sp. UNC138MFCol5.1]|uniref:DUF4381 domain-containing protein n=1 Tax=Luteibacter sp. UNC138MFCol5.1 TaxID=1502774 RepID=UPI0008AE7C37|nr:DUF4381 domain-containing protein [Luteibacter sp. UNC138MFCol5.1]SEO45738.1 protein of unknown function [Luteibacter sp. UNC138MFCol5.1]